MDMHQQLVTSCRTLTVHEQLHKCAACICHYRVNALQFTSLQARFASQFVTDTCMHFASSRITLEQCPFLLAALLSHRGPDACVRSL